MTPSEWIPYIKKESSLEGLIFFGATKLDVREDGVRFTKWLDSKKNAGMEFLENHVDKRLDPSKLFPGAKSALCFGFPYKHECHQQTVSKAAAYACFKDYHSVIKKKLQTILQNGLGQDNFVEEVFKICVDSVPVLERALLSKTDGFIGKNTCFIHTEHGSFVLLGVVLTTLDLESKDKPKLDPTTRTKEGGCGSCKRCQVHCPTGALDEAYQLDARKCLSYWTIEHRGLIPKEFWKHMDKFYFGCDICQDVCPYNRQTKDYEYQDHRKVDLSLKQIALMDQKQYVTWFGGTPMTRAKIFGLKRNALLAMFASGDEETKNTCQKLLVSDFSVVSETAKEILDVM